MDAATLLSEEKFWKIIETSDKGKNLSEIVEKFSDDELIGFRYWWVYFANKLYRQDLWAAVYIVRGGCSDDSFEYFRFWLILQGRQAVYEALQDADSLCRVFEGTSEDPGNEDADWAIVDEMQRRIAEKKGFLDHLKKIEMPEFPGDIEFEWEEDDEESIRNVCPRIFDRYWNQPPFLPAPPESSNSKGFWSMLLRLFTGRRN